MAGNNKEHLKFRIKMAENAERFDEMVELATLLCHNYENLSGDDQNSISLAYKNAVGKRRSSLKALQHNAIDRELTALEEAILKKYKTKIQSELLRMCNDMVEIIDSILIKKSMSTEMKVFNRKLKGDYLRYKSEVVEGNEKLKVEDAAQKSYIDAHETAGRLLSPTNSILIGTSLNYAVFLNEVKGDTKSSIDLCQKTIEAAHKSFVQNSQEPTRETAKILQLLRDNITLWGTQEKSNALKNKK